MRAHQIMTKEVITVTPLTSIAQAAEIMLKNHVSGLPVLDTDGTLVGIVSESDFLERHEIGTGRKRFAWLRFLVGPRRAASDFVHERGRTVADVMSKDPITVDEQTPLDELVRAMEKHDMKRLPVLRNGSLVGIVTRANLLQAVAAIAKHVPDPSENDDRIRDLVLRQVNPTDWRPTDFQVTVHDGIVHLHGIIVNEQTRRAAVIAAENIVGVREVHDHLRLVDTFSGFYVDHPEDDPKQQLQEADKAWAQ